VYALVAQVERVGDLPEGAAGQVQPPDGLVVAGLGGAADQSAGRGGG
jgi:hypothetical protein